jgi:hypothetical protein
MLGDCIPVRLLLALFWLTIFFMPVSAFLPPPVILPVVPTTTAATTSCRTATLDPSDTTTTATTTTTTTNINNNNDNDIVTNTDTSTLTLLEHINLNVPNQVSVLPFYWGVLGCGMDPRKAANLLPASAKKTLWANCGASQFHLPYGETAQRIPGHVGLRYKDLEGLKLRLAAVEEIVCTYQIIQPVGGEGGAREAVRVTDRYGNVFVCREGPDRVDPTAFRQPIIGRHETETWGDVATTYGCVETECRGIDYVEFQCPTGTAAQIALFYESVLDATTSVVQDGDTAVAVVAFGKVDENGKADQSLLFRETDETIPPYDGHHVAMYVGESKADFAQAFKNADMAGVVWVNPRFSDKAHTLQGAQKWKQFRFKDIVDMETGQKIFELEHEMRSVEHEAWPGSL